MPIFLEPAPPDRACEYIRLRGLTRENAVSEARLQQLGITAESWAADIASGELWGTLVRDESRLLGYCFGNTRTGEVVVLALLPDAEGQGLGRHLLGSVVDRLKSHGHQRAFLACCADPQVRSHGFYRHLGWRSTGTLDEHQDELLELRLD